MIKNIFPYIFVAAVVGTSVFYYQKLRYEGKPLENFPAPEEIVQKTIDTVTEGNGVEDFSNRGLTEFPLVVLNRTDTVVLNLSDNNIPSLPSEIGKLVNLQEFYIARSHLRSLPGEIRLFTKLRILDLHDNNLSGIPAEIGQLPAIEKIDLSDNRITDLPNELFTLGHLDELNLTGNPIDEEKITELKTKLPNTEVIF